MTAPLTMVVPTFNEAARLDRDAMLGFLAAAPEHRLCFVDDASSDGTPEVLQALCARSPERMEVVRLPENRGKGEAVRHGLCRALDAGAAFAGFLDADLSAPFSEVPRLRAELDRHPAAWAAFGSRGKLLGRHIVRSELRHYVGRVFATAASWSIRLAVYDTQCGLKLFRNVAEVRHALQEPFLSRWIFDVELLARLSAAADGATGVRVREVPLEFWEDRGDSRLRWRDFLVAPLELWRISRRYRGAPVRDA
jgi:dolichyl-phosphate beta-glucosyltransferase